MTGDIKVLKSHYGVETFRTDDRTSSSITTTIKPGEPVVIGGAGTNFVIPITNGMPTQGTDVWAGVCRKESTETSAVDGLCQVELIGSGSILSGKANTAANINTDAKLLLLLNDMVNFDVAAVTGTNGQMTIDENESAGPSGTLSLMIISGDTALGTLRVAAVNSSIWTGLM